MLNHYGLILLHGFGFPLKGLNSFIEKRVSAKDDAQNITENAGLQNYLDRFCNTNLIINLALQIRKEVSTPIYVSMAPMWSILEKRSDAQKYESIEQYGAQVKNMFIEKVTRFLEAHDIGLIQQPQGTLEDDYFTKEEFIMGYSTNNIRDFGHMNREYGEIALSNMMDTALLHA